MSEANFCHVCGTMIRPYCTPCRLPLPANAKFCGKCGLSLERLSTETSAAPPSLSGSTKPVEFLAPQAPTLPAAILEKYQSAQKAIMSERKLVSIVFADLSGFTSLSERLDPEKVTEIVNQCFQRLGKIVYEHEGYIDKFMGDCIMALFGAPIAHENDPELAIDCALGMLKELRQFADEIHIDLNMSIGINSGIVIAGGVGTDRKLEYTVMGDAVNIAQRLQSTAARGQILVSRNIEKLCRQKFEFETLEPVSLKGKSQPIEVFSVIGRRKNEIKNKSLQAGYSRLIGREREVQIIDRLLEEAKKSKGQLLLISGEPGVGKSRLKHEMKKMGSQKSFLWLEAKCSQLQRESPYHLVTDTLHALFEIDSRTSPPEQREKLSRIKDFKLEKTAEALIRDLLRLQNPDDEPINLPAAQKKKAIFVALKNLFVAAFRHTPTILYFEDLQWIDPISQEFIDEFTEIAPSLSLLLCGGARTDYNHGWGQKRHFTPIVLTSLSADQSVQLAQSLLEMPQLPLELDQLIRNKTDGNPLYIEEIIKSLIDSGKLFKSENQWKISEGITDLDIPPTLQGIIASRIDRLREGDKIALQYASVIGRKFSDQILAKVTPLGDDLYESLKFLRRKELIYEISSEENEITYIFNHALVQEVTYQSILTKTRRQFHEKVAAALEARAQEKQDIDQYIDALAHHYLEAQIDDKAAHYLKLSGQRHANTFSNHGAIKAYTSAIELIEKQIKPDSAVIDRRLFDLYFLISEVYLLIGDFDRAENYQWKMLELGNAKNDLPHLARSFRRLGDIALKRGHLERALEHMHISLDYSVQAKDFEGQIRTYKGIANVWKKLNNLKKSIEIFNQGMEGARSLGNSRLLAEYLNDRATAYIDLQELEKAKTDLETSAEIAQADPSFRSLLISATLNLGVVQYFQKDLPGALAKFRDAAQMSDQIGDLMNKLISIHNQGEIYLEFNQLQDAMIAFEASFRIASEIGNDFEKVNNQILMGHTQLKLGRDLEGFQSLKEATEYARQRKFWQHYCNGLGYQSEFLVKSAEIQKAQEVLEAALEKAREINNPGLITKYERELEVLKKPSVLQSQKDQAS